MLNVSYAFIQLLWVIRGCPEAYKFPEKGCYFFFWHKASYKREFINFYKSLREFIKKFKPKFVVCGHLHENEKKEDKLNNTIILNPGKYGKIIEI